MVNNIDNHYDDARASNNNKTVWNMPIIIAKKDNIYTESDTISKRRRVVVH